MAVRQSQMGRCGAAAGSSIQSCACFLSAGLPLNSASVPAAPTAPLVARPFYLYRRNSLAAPPSGIYRDAGQFPPEK